MQQLEMPKVSSSSLSATGSTHCDNSVHDHRWSVVLHGVLPDIVGVEVAF
jgi:hypothetical protein